MDDVVVIGRASMLECLLIKNAETVNRLMGRFDLKIKHYENLFKPVFMSRREFLKKRGIQRIEL